MFDQPPSLPMRAAIASLLGGLFGVTLILVTHPAQAQTAPSATDTPTVVSAIDDRLKRLGDAALQALRGTEPVYGFSNAGTQFLRLNEAAGEPGSGLRWQVIRIPSWRSEGEIPRSRDLISVGVQVRF